MGAWAAFSVLPVTPGVKRWRKMDFVRIAGLFAVLVCGLVLISTMDARDPKAIGEHEYAKAVNLLNQDQPADALIHLNNALKLVPKNTSAYLDRAAAYTKLQRYDESKADATTALSIEPNNKKAYLERSLGYQHLEKNDLAIADLNKFIVLDPKAAIGYNNRAWSYVVSGRVDEAIADSLMSIKLDKRESTAYDTLGMAYVLKGDYIPALDQFTACLERAPNEGAAMYHKAYAYYCLHQNQLGQAQLKLAQQSFCTLDSFEKHLMAPMFEAYK